MNSTGIVSILENDIQADIIERKELLLQTKTFHLRYSLNANDQQYFLNYSFPIIYSVWEGFIQTTFQTYVREINRLNLRMEEYCDSLKIYNLELRVKQLKKYPSELSKKVAMISKLQQLINSESFQISPIVDTKSNVGFDVLNNILASFNLKPIPDYLRPRYSIAIELDKFLLKIRNDIAHGNNAIIVTTDDVSRAIEVVEILMDEVYERLKNGFIHDFSFKA
ncbi:hypothetical protein EOD41_01095 [Mucilaginibacter limnophilus]|uniref:RiboL-PSP-HEPN domain-containing protein n=1 Tax=Mucilaginibacter limnophilus TaxID=1932778 RepID=A0A3S2UP54_9SPHI|nr:MAE_28990/MAE_18760 family HEPN-like nuclease [Mucilaginibacter limnophilus]RVU02566.1 hypothetical protein EOD41_01095 [Mucilaginibacter limnophilus]